MSAWAKPGVKCVWVDVSENPGFTNRPRPAAKTIVEISGLVISQQTGRLNLIIDGWPNEWVAKPGVELGWRISRFRPLVSQADDIALFTHHFDREGADA